MRYTKPPPLVLKMMNYSHPIGWGIGHFPPFAMFPLSSASQGAVPDRPRTRALELMMRLLVESEEVRPSLVQSLFDYMKQKLRDAKEIFGRWKLLGNPRKPQWSIPSWHLWERM